ncbi:MAG: hypothetical protein AAFN74_24635 [Myxococcota bacterium]
MTNPRSRRRQFPGTETSTIDVPDLPAEPLPPEPGDHKDQFRPNPHAPIVLVPVGKVDVVALERVRPALEEMYRRPTLLVKAMPGPKYAYNPSRTQYHSAAILKRVELLRKSEWDSAIGFVDVDLFVPEVPFIFGEADRSTRAAIISLTRLRPESGPSESRRELTHKRLVSEVVHQVGLIRGLAHCPNNRCVMFYAATVQEIDKRGSTMCANCRKRLIDLY